MTSQEPPRTRVLVIGGWGRCGSTLLDMMLGQVDGFVSAGEVRELWLRGCVENRPCGCGVAFQECEFWIRVGKEAFGGWDQVDLQTMLRVRYHWDRSWNLPSLLRGGSRVEDDEVSAYVEALGRLITAIATVSGASVVVDSSKLPTHTLLLSRVDTLDLRVVHLVRDSRGVAFSNQKHVVKTVTKGEPTLLPRYGAVNSGLRYDFYNAVNGLLRRRFGRAWMRVRYEDVVADPATTLRALTAHATGRGDHDLSFLEGHRMHLSANHMVDGNPVRFSRADIALSVDDEWRRRLSARSRRTMTVLTWPLLHRYGYDSAQ
jgi:hypothetical protein